MFLIIQYKEFKGDFSLKGRVALVVGAAGGIGKSACKLLATMGADIIMADISDKVNEAASEISSLDVKVMAKTTDITNMDNMKSITADGINEFGKIDILVNSAGIAGLIDSAETISEEYFDKNILINLKVPFFMSQIVGNEMIKRKYGKIINISSQAAIIALEHRAAYSASKAGLIGMTKVMAYEWATYNINVNAVSPTFILTEGARKVFSDEMQSQIPAGRFGYPDEVAAAILFLASDASNMITGANLVVDGGYTIV